MSRTGFAWKVPQRAENDGHRQSKIQVLITQLAPGATLSQEKPHIIRFAANKLHLVRALDTVVGSPPGRRKHPVHLVPTAFVVAAFGPHRAALAGERGEAGASAGEDSGQRPEQIGEG